MLMIHVALRSWHDDSVDTRNLSLEQVCKLGCFLLRGAPTLQIRGNCAYHQIQIGVAEYQPYPSGLLFYKACLPIGFATSLVLIK